MKAIKQIRFRGNVQDGLNYPLTLTFNEMISGTAFQNYYPILQLGIQALPGTKFYVNNSSDPIIIGSTGIYELDLDDKVQITNLAFDSVSLGRIRDMINAVLIVDLIYDAGEG